MDIDRFLRGFLIFILLYPQLLHSNYQSTSIKMITADQLKDVLSASMR